MNPSLDPRHVARAVALQILFAKLYADQAAPEIPELLEELEAKKYDSVLVQKIVSGVETHYNSIDQVVLKLAPQWPLAQIAPVDLNIIRIGIWEGFIAQLNPIKVVINEVVDLGKEFGGENSGSFINGVLGALTQNKELQASLTALAKPKPKSATTV